MHKHKALEHRERHEHSHIELDEGKKYRFILVIVLNFSISVFEIIAGVISSSVALIADAFHNLQDTASVVLSFLAWKISFKRPDRYKTYGYKRAEILAAFLNSFFLILLSILLIIESVKRFFAPEEINSDFMLISAFLAFAVNIASVFLLKKDSHESINWRGAYLHMLGDAFFSLAVIAGAISVRFWHIFWIDPVLSFFMSFFIIAQAVKVFKKSLDILMQSSANLDYETIKKDIESISGINNIHHVHTWMTDENTVYFEAHIEVGDMSISQTCGISQQVESLLKNKYGVYHTTLQFETDRCRRKEMFC